MGVYVLPPESASAAPHAKLRRMPRITLALTLAICLGVSAAAAAYSVTRADAVQTQLNDHAAAGRTTRATIAESELDLCVRIYSQITLTERVAYQQATLTYYRQVLPDIADRTIRRLLANNRRQIRILLAEYNPAHCHDLPSQQYLNG